MFTLAGSRPRSRTAAMVTTAKASLISHRSTSPTLQPVLASSFCMAPTGAVVNQAGAWAWVVWPTIRAMGRAPIRSAVEARISTRAAAPSEMELELAGVTVPSLRKAGLRLGIFSTLALGGCSSSLICTSPLRPATVTGATSQAKEPSWMAAWARRVEAIAQASGGLLAVAILQTVEEHVVDHLAVAQAVAAASLGQEVGSVAHRLHAAGHHHLVAAGRQQIVGQHGRLHPGTAHRADGGAAGGQRQAGVEG